MRLSEEERAYFKACSDELLEHHLVQSMSRYEQHGTTNRLDHSVQVAQYSYWVSKKLKLKLDQKSLIRGALLHDFFLYDPRQGRPSREMQAFCHPKVAAANSEDTFDITEKEKEAILSHMFPLGPLPKTQEAWIISGADKLCACVEVFHIGIALSRNGRVVVSAA